MNSLKIRWVAFAVGAIATLGIPASAIWSHYQTLEHGETVKFRLVPVDPYDPFRGRYVALRLENNRVPAANPNEQDTLQGESAYLSFTTDADGFASPIALHEKAPQDSNYIKVYNIWEIRTNEFTYQLPFDRYYLNENDAPLAEQIARDSVRAGVDDATESVQLPSHLVLRILDGDAAIVTLMIDNKPVEERIREERLKGTQ